MPAFRDKRYGTWRYRKRVKLPSGIYIRIEGTPATDTKVAAESAERAHVDRVLQPGYVHVPGRRAVSAPKGVLTVEGFAPKFLKEYLPRSKPTERRSKQSIVNGEGGLVQFFGPYRLDEINQGHVNAFVIAQGSKSTKTINNKLTVLSTMLRYAHELDLIKEPRLKCHIKSMSPDIVAVPAEDVSRLIDHADLRFRVAILLASEAGLRVGEIRGLQWTDIKGGQLTVRRAIDQEENVTTPKHDKRRAVPLSPALAAALKALPRRGLWVIAGEDGVPTTYEAALQALNALYIVATVTVPVSETGVTMPWHSLRHTFGTELAARGVPVPVIKELMGHASITTTMRYVTVTGAQLDDAIEQAFGAGDADPKGRQAGDKPEHSRFANREQKAKPPGNPGA